MLYIDYNYKIFTYRIYYLNISVYNTHYADKAC